MKTTNLIRRNLSWYRRTNLAVILGVATAVAVLTGALLVGDSVRGSLRELALGRLGRTDLLISGQTFFREALVAEMKADPVFGRDFADGVALIAQPGVAWRDENGARAGDVQVYGVDQRFWDFHRGHSGKHDTGEITAPGSGEALISAGLAAELGAQAGELTGEMLAVRIELPAAIPVESLHGRRDETGRTIRFTVREVLPAGSPGDFSLQPRQGAVRAIFLPLDRLQRNLDQDGRVNVMLLARPGASQPGAGGARLAADELLRAHLTLADQGIRVRSLSSPAGEEFFAVETESAIISDPLAEAVGRGAAELGGESRSFLSYLANSIRSGGRDIPYSLVTAIEPGLLPGLARGEGDDLPPLVLNDWAARELGVKIGAEVDLDYYVWEDEGRLGTGSTRFRLVGITPIAGLAADRQLAPEYPGITGAESLSDWDPPFPLDLGRVRPVDEAYWDRYRATPKAFVLLDDVRTRWGTRYGALTSIRLNRAGLSEGEVGAALTRAISPGLSGLAAVAVREQGAAAARGATDFGAYFSYFSFFLVVAALLLVVLFFRLGVEQRTREIGLYRALGYSMAMIRRIFLREGLALALLGSLVGSAGALGYAALMMYGLRTWWQGAVGTSLLRLHVAPWSLAGGVGAGLAATALCLWWTLRRVQLGSPRSQLAGVITGEGMAGRGRSPRRWRIGVSLALAAGVMLALGAGGLVPAAAGFFGAGALFLLAMLTLLGWWLRGRLAPGLSSPAALGLRNATMRPGRSLLSMALIAAATFVIVSVEAFRRGEVVPSTDRSSGTGGFLLVAESLLPIADNPDLPEGRAALDLNAPLLEGLRITRLRMRNGDDASCLNLYQPRQPRVLGVPPEFMAANRFSFSGMVEPSPNPWQLLDRADGPVPVIVDANSMKYVLHRALGETFAIPAGNGEMVEVRIVATLADSLLQSELLMAESNFVRLYPREEGYRWFGVERVSGTAESEAIAALLEERLGDFGFDATSAAARLAGYHEVENTYLSTFQAIGGLGLLLGTVGLGAVLLRNVLERRRELALLQTVGYRARHLVIIVVAENLLLLGGGLLTGTTGALLAILPALIERGGSLSFTSLGLLLATVLVTGLAASLLAVRAAVRSPVLAALRRES